MTTATLPGLTGQDAQRAQEHINAAEQRAAMTGQSAMEEAALVLQANAAGIPPDQARSLIKGGHDGRRTLAMLIRMKAEQKERSGERAGDVLDLGKVDQVTTSRAQAMIVKALVERPSPMFIPMFRPPDPPDGTMPGYCGPPGLVLEKQAGTFLSGGWDFSPTAELYPETEPSQPCLLGCGAMFYNSPKQIEYRDVHHEKKHGGRWAMYLREQEQRRFEEDRADRARREAQEIELRQSERDDRRAALALEERRVAALEKQAAGRGAK